MIQFKEKTVVITGAASGIGRALAIKFAQYGAKLALCDKDTRGLAETAELVKAGACMLKTYELDVSDRKQFYDVATAIGEEFKHVDIVINNAGVAVRQTVEEMSYEDYEWLLGINLWGVIYGTKAFLPMLHKSSAGRVVNISSVFGIIGVSGQSAYNISKFGVRGFTEALRHELIGSSTKAICVHPGGIRTNIAKNARAYSEGEADQQEFMQRFDTLAKTTAEQAAVIIIRGIAKDKERILVGFDAKLIDWIQRLFPQHYARITERLMSL